MMKRKKMMVETKSVPKTLHLVRQVSKVLSIIVVFDCIFHLPTTAEAIVCYQCDATSSPISNCPGWFRRPIDTFKDLNDHGGLFTHCLEIRLANGTIIHQGAYPEHPTCGRDFRTVWKQTLERRYKHRVWVRCCDYNLCNGPGLGPRPPCGLWSLLASSVIVFALRTTFH